jgi:acetyltransferase-like isoleucine patch superfamily enzyme
MRTLGNIFLAFLPSFLHVNIRRLVGQKIGKGSKIKFGTLILTREIEIGKKTKIGPFSLIRSKNLKIGNNCNIKSLSSCTSRIIRIEDYVHIAPLCIVNGGFGKKSSFEVSDHSRIFPFCWIDSAQGVKIGKHVGIGGHSLLFTHGVWANYINGGPISFAPIEIEDNVWLPWRVFIMPGVTIGKNAIIGANSLINKDIPANSLAAGSPAKIIKEMPSETSSTEKRERISKILGDFADDLNFWTDSTDYFEKDAIFQGPDFTIAIDDVSSIKNKGILICLGELSPEHKADQLSRGVDIIEYQSLTIYKGSNNNSLTTKFVPFLRKYGVRLYEK